MQIQTDPKKSNQSNRSTHIIRTNWIGIAANVFLAVFKGGVGIVASSVAIVMDAVNNLSATLVAQITAEIQPLVPGMQVVVVVDHNYSE